MITVGERKQMKYLCTGCGTCAAICPVNAIKMEINYDQFFPVVNTQLCIKCGKCVNVCPGISISIRKFADKFYPGAKEDFRLGKFRTTYIGYSNDPQIRFEATSGGIATSLAKFLLKNKIVDGVVVTKMCGKNPLIPESFIARTEEGVISAKTSKYTPTSPIGVLKEIKSAKETEKFAIIGLPCHIHGLRKLQEIEPWAKKKIIFSIGLFCGHEVTFSGTKFILERFAKGSKDIESIQWRGRGWPGGISVQYKDGKKIDILHEMYWPPFFSTYFFTPYRCLTCHDLTSELADISLGDAWLKEIKEHDNIGTSIIIARSKLGERILKQMTDEKELTLIEISYTKVIEAQRGILARKKIGVGSRMKLFRLLSKPIPNYDQHFGYSRRGIIGALMIFFSTAFSKTILGQKILRHIPIKFLIKYRKYMFRFGGV